MNQNLCATPHVLAKSNFLKDSTQILIHVFLLFLIFPILAFADFFEYKIVYTWVQNNIKKSLSKLRALFLALFFEAKRVYFLTKSGDIFFQFLSFFTAFSKVPFWVAYIYKTNVNGQSAQNAKNNLQFAPETRVKKYPFCFSTFFSEPCLFSMAPTFLPHFEWKY